MSASEYSYRENHRLCKHFFILDFFVKVRQFSHSLHSQRQDKIFLNQNLQKLKTHCNQINNCKYWEVEQFLNRTATHSNPKTFSFGFKEIPMLTFLTFATFSNRKF